MDRDFIVARVAPCGLHCGACLAFDGGKTQARARDLARLLGSNFAAYAERFAAMNPVFAEYGAFARVLGFLAEGSCSGCRGAGCLFAACKAGTCSKDRGVDFCFQCADFPCDAHGMPDMLAARWRANNEKMRDMGVEAYYGLIKDKPRYP